MNIVSKKVMQMTGHDRLCDCKSCQHWEQVVLLELEDAYNEENGIIQEKTYYRFNEEGNSFERI